MGLHDDQCIGRRNLNIPEEEKRPTVDIQPRIVSENGSESAKVASIMDREDEIDIAVLTCD